MNIRPIQQLDQTIAERIAWIEQVLKHDPLVSYRRQLMKEYLALTTDPEERHASR